MIYTENNYRVNYEHAFFRRKDGKKGWKDGLGQENDYKIS